MTFSAVVRSESAKVAASARTKVAGVGAGSTRRGTGGSPLAPPLARAGTGPATRSTWAAVIALAPNKRTRMMALRGMRRSLCTQRRKLRAVMSNHAAARRCGIPSTLSVVRNSAAAAARSLGSACRTMLRVLVS